MATDRYASSRSQYHVKGLPSNRMIGNLTEIMGDLDGAINAFEQALRHNQYSIPAMNAISCILRTKENFPRAVEYLQAIVKLESNNGEVWGSLGMPATSENQPELGANNVKVTAT